MDVTLGVGVGRANPGDEREACEDPAESGCADEAGTGGCGVGRRDLAQHHDRERAQGWAALDGLLPKNWNLKGHVQCSCTTQEVVPFPTWLHIRVCNQRSP